MSSPLPSVAVIVLNWNGIDDTMECVESLLRVDYPHFEVVVVDNGSTLSPRARISAAFPTVTILETGLNLTAQDFRAHLALRVGWVRDRARAAPRAGEASHEPSLARCAFR